MHIKTNGHSDLKSEITNKNVILITSIKINIEIRIEFSYWEYAYARPRGFEMWGSKSNQTDFKSYFDIVARSTG